MVGASVGVGVGGSGVVRVASSARVAGSTFSSGDHWIVILATTANAFLSIRVVVFHCVPILLASAVLGIVELV